MRYRGKLIMSSERPRNKVAIEYRVALRASKRLDIPDFPQTTLCMHSWARQSELSIGLAQSIQTCSPNHQSISIYIPVARVSTCSTISSPLPGRLEGVCGPLCGRLEGAYNHLDPWCAPAVPASTLSSSVFALLVFTLAYRRRLRGTLEVQSC